MRLTAKDFSIRLNLCVAGCSSVAASVEDISTAEESWWNTRWKKLVEHQKEHVRMDSRGYIGTCIIWIDPKVIYGLTKYY